jgi:hypothetical protein
MGQVQNFTKLTAENGPRESEMITALYSSPYGQTAYQKYLETLSQEVLVNVLKSTHKQREVSLSGVAKSARTTRCLDKNGKPLNLDSPLLTPDSNLELYLAKTSKIIDRDKFLGVAMPNPYAKPTILHHYWNIGFQRGKRDAASNTLTPKKDLLSYACHSHDADTDEELYAFISGYQVGLIGVVNAMMIAIGGVNNE